MERRFKEDPAALFRLCKFVMHRLPEEHHEQFQVLMDRAIEASQASTIESSIAITDGGNRYKRLKDQYEKVVDIVGQISATCFEHHVEAVRPHFLSLGRVFHEFDAPFPTRDELRADFYKELAEALEKRKGNEVSFSEVEPNAS